MQKGSFPKNSPEPLLTSIEGGARMLGLGRSKTLQLVYAGEIESVLIGRRRLLKIASINRLAQTGGGQFLRAPAPASLDSREAI
jgi:excisionase family DNA binding protein